MRPEVRRPGILGTAGEPAAFEQTLHPGRDQCHNTRDLLARESAHRMKVHRLSVRGKHAVQHERVEVDVEIQGAAKALHDRYRAAPAVGDALMSGATP